MTQLDACQETKGAASPRNIRARCSICCRFRSGRPGPGLCEDGSDDLLDGALGRAERLAGVG